MRPALLSPPAAGFSLVVAHDAKGREDPGCSLPQGLRVRAVQLHLRAHMKVA